MIRRVLLFIRIPLCTVIAIVIYPIFFFYTRAYEQRKSGNRKRILIIPQLTRIGDVICATPVFKAVKEAYPDCFLSVLVTPKSYPIVKNNPHIDDFLMFEYAEYEAFFGIFRFFKKVRERRFDWSFNIAASTLGTLAAVYGCVPRRVKITRRKRPVTEMLSDWMNHDRILYADGEYLPALYVRTLGVLGISIPENIRKEVFRTLAGDRKADVFLREHAFVPSDMVIGVSVSAGNRIKEWGIEKFQSLLLQIQTKYPVKIVFIGTLNERGKIDALNARIGNSGVNAAGMFSLEDLPSLMARFNMFIAADSGTIHIADALAVPLIDIVGPVDPYEQTPRGAMSIIVKPPENIAPAIFAFRPALSGEDARRAAQAISVNDVLMAFNRLYDTISKQ